MNSPTVDLLQWRDKLHRYAADYEESPDKAKLEAIWEKAMTIGKSSSRSWMGYHANVYYQDFAVPPTGNHFDVEHGTRSTAFGIPNRNWIERSEHDVRDLIVGEGGEDALRDVAARGAQGLELLASAKADVLSLISLYLADHEDPFARRILEEIEKIEVLDTTAIANQMSPGRKILTFDLKAAQQGEVAPLV